MPQPTMFAQLSKVDAEKRLVYGRLADASVDKAEEAMDYGKSKPYFQKWSETIAKESGGKSVGNLRAMHGKVAAGKFVEINFDDKAQAIDVVAKVVDDNEWKKVLEGVYTGFSIGGSYVDRNVEKMADGREIKRYVADPTEGSLVDRPCNPSATFFDVQKADGSIEKVEFKKSEEALVVQGTEDQVAELAKLMNEQGLTMADVLAKISTPAPVAPPAESPAPSLRKAAVPLLAALTSGLIETRAHETLKALLQADEPLAKALDAVLVYAGDLIKGITDAELAQATLAKAAPDEELAKLAASSAELAKGYPDAFLELVKAGARNSAADQNRLQAIHDAVGELGAKCPDSDMDGKAHAHGDLEKALAAATEPLNKALEAANARIAKLEAVPEIPRVAISAIGKTQDLPASNEAAKVDTAPIKDDHGEEHVAAGLIKSLHRTGGTPLNISPR